MMNRGGYAILAGLLAALALALTLVGCSSSNVERKAILWSGSVDAAGVTISLPELTLEIPANAVEEPLYLVISTIEASTDLTPSFSALAPVIVLEPADYSFHIPAVITFPLAAQKSVGDRDRSADSTKRRRLLWTAKGSRNKWVELPAAADATTLRGSIDYLGRGFPGVSAGATLCLSDAYEDNGDMAAAAILPTAKSYYGLTICAQDEDWFALSLEPGCALTASIRFILAQGALSLHLLNASGIEIALSDGADDNMENLRWRHPDYEKNSLAAYLVVSSGGQSVDSVYILDVAVDCQSPAPDGDADTADSSGDADVGDHIEENVAESETPAETPDGGENEETPDGDGHEEAQDFADAPDSSDPSELEQPSCIDEICVPEVSPCSCAGVYCAFNAQSLSGVCRSVVSLTYHTEYVASVAFTPDGARLVSVSADTTAAVWRAPEVEPEYVLLGHGAVVSAVATSPDNSYVFTGGWDRSLRRWSLDDGSEADQFKHLDSTIRAAALSPDGSLLAAGGYGAVELWRVADHTVVLTIDKLATWVNHLEFSPSGVYMAAATESGVTTLRLSNGQRSSPQSPDPGAVRRLAYSPDGKMLAVVTGDGYCIVYSPDSWQELYRSAIPGALSLAFSPGGELLAIGGYEQLTGVSAILILSRTDWSMSTLISGRFSQIRSLQFSPDGRLLASASDDAIVRLWDVSSFSQAWSYGCSRDDACQPDQYCNRHLHRCVTSPCRDGVDNDNDLLVDEQDPDCAVGAVEFVNDSKSSPDGDTDTPSEE